MTWPLSYCFILRDGWNQAPASTTRDFPTDHPAGRRARLYTGGPEIWSGQFQFRTRADLETFRTWGRSTLSGYAATFSLPNPFGAGTYTAQFMGEPPSSIPAGGDVWRVPFQMKVWV